jgi:hypothetical protein
MKTTEIHKQNLVYYNNRGIASGNKNIANCMGQYPYDRLAQFLDHISFLESVLKQAGVYKSSFQTLFYSKADFEHNIVISMYKYDYGLLLEDLWRSNVTYGRTKNGYINLNGPVVKVDIIDPDYDIRNLVVYKSKGAVKDETFTKYIVKKYSKDRYEDLQEGKYYLHSDLGIVRLDDKPNICVTTEDGESYLVKLDSLSEIKNNLRNLTNQLTIK